MSADVYWEVVVILLLILLNGFFSLAEMSMVAAKKVRLSAAAKQGDKRSALALLLLEEPDRLFSTVQIGITLIGILTGAFGGATLGEQLGHWLAGYDVLKPFADTLGFGVVILATTYLTLVFGELIPKKMAFSDPERFARLASPLMLLLRKVAHPAVAVLSSSSRLASRLMGMNQEAQQITEEDIKGFINEGVRAGFVQSSEKDMLERVFRLGDRRVSSLMRHRSKVVWLDVNDSDKDILAQMAESPYSRYPVCDGDLHAVLGVVKAREFLAARVADPAARLDKHLHAPVFIQDTARATSLLEAFQGRSRMRFAMVVDEYGDIMGIATLYDILEALVGDLPDHKAGEESEAVKRADGSWLLDGLIPMEDACQVAGICRDQDALEPYETLAGFILHHLQRIPDVGDVVEGEGFRFEIVDMDGRRIDRVLVTKQPVGQSQG